MSDMDTNENLKQIERQPAAAKWLDRQEQGTLVREAQRALNAAKSDIKKHQAVRDLLGLDCKLPRKYLEKQPLCVKGLFDSSADPFSAARLNFSRGAFRPESNFHVGVERRRNLSQKSNVLYALAAFQPCDAGLLGADLARQIGLRQLFEYSQPLQLVGRFRRVPRLAEDGVIQLLFQEVLVGRFFDSHFIPLETQLLEGV